MKINRLRRCLNALLGLVAVSLAAQESATVPYGPTPFREYGWVEFGYAHLPTFDATLSTLTPGGTLSQDLQMKMGPGFAVHGGLGESFSRWISGELLSGFYYHSLDEVTGAGASASRFDTSVLQVPIMLNLVVQVPLHSRLKPVLGAGAGAVISWLDVNDQLAAGDGTYLYVNDSSTEVTFAWQAFGGVRYQYGDSASVSLMYRYTGVGSPTWSLEETGTGRTVADLHAHDIGVHTIALGFQIAF